MELRVVNDFFFLKIPINYYIKHKFVLEQKKKKKRYTIYVFAFFQIKSTYLNVSLCCSTFIKHKICLIQMNLIVFSANKKIVLNRLFSSVPNNIVLVYFFMNFNTINVATFGANLYRTRGNERGFEG